MEDKLKKINTLREKVESLKSEKERINGRIETQEQRLTQMEVECKEKYKCSIEQLPALAKKLEKESTELILEAETILAGSKPEGDETDG